MQDSSEHVAQALVELLQSRPGEDMCRTMECCLGKAMSDDGSFRNYTAVAHELLNKVIRLASHFETNDRALPAATLYLRVLHAIAIHKPNVCSGKVPELLRLYEHCPHSQYAVLHLLVMKLLILMFDARGTLDEVRP